MYVWRKGLKVMAFENIVGKEKNNGNQPVLLFPHSFMSFCLNIELFESHLTHYQTLNDQSCRCIINREYVYSAVVYQKISNEVEGIDNFRALARKLSFLSTSLDIFDIRQHYVRILFIFQCLIC